MGEGRRPRLNQLAHGRRDATCFGKEYPIEFKACHDSGLEHAKNTETAIIRLTSPLRFFYLTVSLAVVLTAVCDASASEKKEKQSLRDRYALPSHVQLRPMMVPISHQYQTVSVISVFLEANRKKEVGAICHKVPRVRDAILRTLSVAPIQTRRGKLLIDGVAERLIGPINAVLDDTKIKSIHIEPGMIRAQASGGLSRLPFATINGCKGIKEIELDLVKEEQKAKEAK